MLEEFDQELSRCLKAGLERLTEAERRALISIWRYPNVPVKILPTMVGDEPGGSVWLRVGMLAKTKLWHRMPRRIKSELQRPGRKPFYSGLLVDLDVVEDKRRDRWTVFELRREAVKALQSLKVIGGIRHAPSRAYKLLSEVELEEVPAGFTAPAETKRISRSIIERRGQAPFRRDLLAAYSGQCASPAALRPTSSKQLTSWASKIEVGTRSQMVYCFGPTGTHCSIWAYGRFTQDGGPSRSRQGWPRNTESSMVVLYASR